MENKFRGWLRFGPVAHLSAASLIKGFTSDHRAKMDIPFAQRLMSEVGVKALMILAIENRGGVGKTTAAGTAVEAMSTYDERVDILDFDDSNQQMSLYQNARAVGDGNMIGALQTAIGRIQRGEVDFVIGDTGAQSEALINAELGEIAAALSAVSARLVVLRPLTLCPKNQNNIIHFVDHVMTDDMGVVIVRNLGQGRKVQDYAYWASTATRARLLATGVVEIDLEDAGAAHSDRAMGCGLTLADVALGRFTKAGKYEKQALSFFDTDAQNFLARWLFRQTLSFQNAIIASLKKPRA